MFFIFTSALGVRFAFERTPARARRDLGANKLLEIRVNYVRC